MTKFIWPRWLVSYKSKIAKWNSRFTYQCSGMDGCWAEQGISMRAKWINCYPQLNILLWVWYYLWTEDLSFWNNEEFSLGWQVIAQITWKICFWTGNAIRVSEMGLAQLGELMTFCHTNFFNFFRYIKTVKPVMVPIKKIRNILTSKWLETNNLCLFSPDKSRGITMSICKAATERTCFHCDDMKNILWFYSDQEYELWKPGMVINNPPPEVYTDKARVELVNGETSHWICEIYGGIWTGEILCRKSSTVAMAARERRREMIYLPAVSMLKNNNKLIITTATSTLFLGTGVSLLLFDQVCYDVAASRQAAQLTVAQSECLRRLYFNKITNVFEDILKASPAVCKQMSSQAVMTLRISAE